MTRLRETATCALNIGDQEIILFLSKNNTPFSH